MPTISQLPPATQVAPADQIPLSQAGATHSVSLGTLLAGTQPAILAGSGTLLGRTSIGPGGPEAITPGAGLALSGTTLSATGMDHATFPAASSLVATDQVVLSSSGQPKLLEVARLRGLFEAGSNISIGSDGTIEAHIPTNTIVTLPAASAPSGQDLIGISQGGVDYAISYATLIDGQTIDMAQAAAPAQDSDEFWVSQGGSSMMRQNLGALWAWVTSKLPAYQQPVLELTADTTLDGTVHNGRMLICTQPISVTATSLNLGNGFACDIINLSSGAVTLSGAVLTSSGMTSIEPDQMAALRCGTFSGGSIIYASLSYPGGTSSPPTAVTALSASAATLDSVALSWAGATQAASYLVEYRVQGTTSWTLATSGLTTPFYTVGGLLQNTNYDFGVVAVNAAGSTSPTVITAATLAALTVPGQVTGVSTTGVTTNSVVLTWTAPTTGAAPSSYVVQFRLSNTTSWTGSLSGITGTQATVTGLSAGSSYDFEVLASNAAGTGTPSAVFTASTNSASGSVTAVTWNLVPSSSYTHGTGSVAVNAHITPATAPVQFGLSTSTTTQPAVWVAGSNVNTDLWGAYLPTPTSTGSYYVWVSGTDGSYPTVYPTSFAVI